MNAVCWKKACQHLLGSDPALIGNKLASLPLFCQKRDSLFAFSMRSEPPCRRSTKAAQNVRKQPVERNRFASKLPAHGICHTVRPSCKALCVEAVLAAVQWSCTRCYAVIFSEAAFRDWRSLFMSHHTFRCFRRREASKANFRIRHAFRAKKFFFSFFFSHTFTRSHFYSHSRHSYSHFYYSQHTNWTILKTNTHSRFSLCAVYIFWCARLFRPKLDRLEILSPQFFDFFFAFASQKIFLFFLKNVFFRMCDFWQI